MLDIPDISYTDPDAKAAAFWMVYINIIEFDFLCEWPNIEFVSELFCVHLF